VSIIDQPTRSEIIEGLTNLTHRARREMPVTRRFTTDEPTPWDQRHATIDDLLDELERVRG
jgi:hypothetical protein